MLCCQILQTFRALTSTFDAGKTHYKFPPVALSSITNRVTGCVLSGGPRPCSLPARPLFAQTTIGSTGPPLAPRLALGPY